MLSKVAYSLLELEKNKTIIIREFDYGEDYYFIFQSVIDVLNRNGYDYDLDDYSDNKSIYIRLK